jgi:hypothetical protein
MLNKSITSLMSALVLAVLSITPSNAQEINLGGFVGNVSTVVTHGVALRAEDNNCMLVSGSANTQTEAMKALCNYKREDVVAATTTGREISIGSVASDDGRLNFQKGDVIDAGQTVAVSFFGDNASGIRLSLSGVAMVNPLLDINDVAFKTLSSDAKDHLESDFKLGNAYISESGYFCIVSYWCKRSEFSFSPDTAITWCSIKRCSSPTSYDWCFNVS